MRIRGYGNHNPPPLREEGAADVATRAMSRLTGIIVDDANTTLKDISEKGLTTTVTEQTSDAIDVINESLTSLVGWWRGEPPPQETPEVVESAAEILVQGGGVTGAAYGVTTQTATGGIQAVWVLPEDANPSTVAALASIEGQPEDVAACASVTEGVVNTRGVSFLVDRVANNEFDPDMARKVLAQCAESGTDGHQLAAIVCDRVRKLFFLGKLPTGEVKPEEALALTNCLVFIDALFRLDTNLSRVALEDIKSGVRAEFLGMDRCSHYKETVVPMLTRIGLVESQPAPPVAQVAPRGSSQDAPAQIVSQTEPEVTPPGEEALETPQVIQEAPPEVLEAALEQVVCSAPPPPTVDLISGFFDSPRKPDVEVPSPGAQISQSEVAPTIPFERAPRVVDDLLDFDMSPARAVTDQHVRLGVSSTQAESPSTTAAQDPFAEMSKVSVQAVPLAGPLDFDRTAPVVSLEIPPCAMVSDDPFAGLSPQGSPPSVVTAPTAGDALSDALSLAPVQAAAVSIPVAVPPVALLDFDCAAPVVSLEIPPLAQVSDDPFAGLSPHTSPPSAITVPAAGDALSAAPVQAAAVSVPVAVPPGRALDFDRAGPVVSLEIPSCARVSNDPFADLSPHTSPPSTLTAPITGDAVLAAPVQVAAVSVPVAVPPGGPLDFDRATPVVSPEIPPCAMVSNDPFADLSPHTSPPSALTGDAVYAAPLQVAAVSVPVAVSPRGPLDFNRAVPVVSPEIPPCAMVSNDPFADLSTHTSPPSALTAPTTGDAVLAAPMQVAAVPIPVAITAPTTGDAVFAAPVRVAAVPTPVAHSVVATAVPGAIDFDSMFAAVGVPRPAPFPPAVSPLVPKSSDPFDGCTASPQASS